MNEVTRSIIYHTDNFIWYATVFFQQLKIFSDFSAKIFLHLFDLSHFCT